MQAPPEVTLSVAYFRPLGSSSPTAADAIVVEMSSSSPRAVTRVRLGSF
ncbi:MAG TPA: hypothetical protein VLK84_28675 [Longimicrobium sp.]|nr:hypothetical protein [Longimicrobium sp.]